MRSELIKKNMVEDIGSGKERSISMGRKMRRKRSMEVVEEGEDSLER